MTQTIRLKRCGDTWLMDAKISIFADLQDISDILGEKIQTEEDIIKGLFLLKAEEMFYIDRPLNLSEYSDGMITEAFFERNRIIRTLRNIKKSLSKWWVKV